jgi:hypothetical protein
VQIGRAARGHLLQQLINRVVGHPSYELSAGAGLRLRGL